MKSRRLLVILGVALTLAVAIGLGVDQYLRRHVGAGLLDGGLSLPPEKEEVNAGALAALTTADLSRPKADAALAWPQWRGPNRDGVAPPGPLRTDWAKEPPTPLWTIPCGGGYSSFAVVGVRAYTQDRQGGNERTVCLDAATGNTIWAHGEPADYNAIQYAEGPRATPAVDDGRVYTVGASGIFLCLEAEPAAGQPPKVLWRHDLERDFHAPRPQWGYACSPLVEGDLVIVQPGGKDSSVVAFDRASGEVRWKAGSDPSGYSSPVAVTAAGQRQIVAVTGRSVLGLAAADGRVLWSHDWRTQFDGNVATPVVVGDYVFVSSGYTKGCALLHLTPDAGGVKKDLVYFRKSRVMQNHHSSGVVRDGFVYGFDGDSAFRCVDLRKGEGVDGWEGRDADNRVLPKGCLILADKFLIGLTEKGSLFLADADPVEFRLHGKLDGVLTGPQCWALPVLVDGRLYLRDGSKIVCLDVRPTTGVVK